MSGKKRDVLDIAKYEIHYWFLRRGLLEGLPFNEQVYGAWGSAEEIKSWSFKKWWAARGEAIAGQREIQEARVVGKSATSVTIEFPLSMASAQVKARASALVAKARGTKHIKGGAKTAKFEYVTLKQIQRFLKVDLDPEYSGSTLEQRGEVLREIYVALSNKHDKAIKKYSKHAEEHRAAGKSDSARKYRRRALALEEFRDKYMPQWDPSFGKELRDLNPDVLGRWAVQGRIILLNVAKGQFPGTDWYGNKRHATYKKLLGEFGIEAIGSERHVGGAKNRGVAEAKRRGKERKDKGLIGYGGNFGTAIGAPASSIGSSESKWGAAESKISAPSLTREQWAKVNAAKRAKAKSQSPHMKRLREREERELLAAAANAKKSKGAK